MVFPSFWKYLGWNNKKEFTLSFFKHCKKRHLMTSCSTLFVMSIIWKEGVGNMGWTIWHIGVFVNTSTLLSFEVLIELPLPLSYSLLLSTSLHLSQVSVEMARDPQSLPHVQQTHLPPAAGPPTSLRATAESPGGLRKEYPQYLTRHDLVVLFLSLYSRKVFW